ITLTYEGADVEDAYAIGQMVTDMKVANGRVIKGHKVGLTSKAMRSTTGATEPTTARCSTTGSSTRARGCR
ncbi:MAG: hypothetical protein P8N02_04315, partial [Actinomycetota bacterium]|nr:hypothetical protein [Actinomycetota bacterium]